MFRRIVAAVDDSVAVLTNCSVAQNTGGEGGGGVAAKGLSSVTLMSCNVSDNRAPSGGGILADGASGLHLAASVVSGNKATRTGG